MSWYSDNRHDSQQYRFPFCRSTPVAQAYLTRHPFPGLRHSTRDENSSLSVLEHPHRETHQQHTCWIPCARRCPECHPLHSLSGDFTDWRHWYCCAGARTQMCRCCDPGRHIRRSDLETHPRGNDCIQRPHHSRSRGPCRHENPRRNTTHNLSDFSSISENEDNEDVAENEATSDEIPDRDAMDYSDTTTNANRTCFRYSPSQNVHAHIRRRNDNYLSFVDSILRSSFADDVLGAGTSAQHRRRGRQMRDRLIGGNSRARDESSQSARRLYR